MTTVTKDFLVELGTEELPPTQLKKLSDAFTQGIEAGLAEAGLSSSSEGNIEVISYAAPRRLAVMVKNLADKQQDRDEVIYGPPANIAFDADGKPTKAALGFAKKSGASVEDLSEENGKLKISRRIAGQATTELLAAIIQSSLEKLPIAKRMRWGSSRIEFVRPVQWLIMLFGNEVIKGEVLGVAG